MTSSNQAREEPVRKRKSTLLSAVPLDTPPSVAPPQKAGGAGKVIATVLVLGLMGGAYYATTLSEDTQTANIAPAPTRATQTATATADSTPAEPAVVPAVEAPETVVVETPQAEVEVPAETVAEVAEIEILRPLAGAPACENAIYSDLSTLQRASITGGTWSSHQSHVTNLVQNVINCDGTSFDVVGSFDSLNDGEANLSVLWDSSSKFLLLEMIPVASEPTAQAESGDALFVLR